MDKITVYVDDVPFQATANDIVETGTGESPGPNIDPVPQTLELKNVGLISRSGNEPAIIYNDEYCVYVVNGKKHREGDLPAVMNKNVVVEYWKDGLRHRSPDTVSKRCQPAIEFLRRHPRFETKLFYRKGKLHREDGPAIDSYTGTLMYLVDGVLCRGSDLPAIICCTGTMVFFEDGTVTRRLSNLPSVICSDGTCMFFDEEGKLNAPKDLGHAVRFVCDTTVFSPSGNMLSVPAMSSSVYESGVYVSGVEFDYKRKIREALKEGDFDDFWNDDTFEFYGLRA